MKGIMVSIGIAAAVLTLGGCLATKEIKTPADLYALDGIGPLRALTVDSVLYTFDRFRFTDSTLSGKGVAERNGEEEPFEETLPFSRIVFLEGRALNFWKSAWVIPAAVIAAGGLASALQDPSSFTMHRPYGGSSCPYIYSFDGKEYRLDAEAFGTSVSNAFEAETYSVLPSLAADRKRLSIRIANERPETHVINRVRLFAADAGTASRAVLDTENRLWALRHPASPVCANDHSGRNVRGELSANDRLYWASDLAHIDAFSGFRDEIELEFDLPERAREGTLVIDAVNTDLVTEAYHAAGAVLGDASLLFYQALEHDPALQQEIRAWIADCSLRIERWEDGEWKEAGRLAPEASLAPFARAIRLGGLDSKGGRIRLRLTTLTDVWKIDAVSLDCSAARPLPLQALEMISARTADESDCSGAISLADSVYKAILPPDRIEASFSAHNASGMQHPIFVLAAQGYLYEWLPSAEHAAPSIVPASLSRSGRVGLLTLLIAQKDLFLPAVYAEWARHDRKSARNEGGLAFP